jgi:amino acid transporter
VRQLTAAVCNVTIGAGIYLLPGRVGAELGAAALLAYVICAVAIILVMLCFAMAGSRVTASGGPYAYVEAAFGSRVGFIAGFLFCASAVMAVGGIAREFVGVFAAILPAPLADVPRWVWLALIITALAWCNIRGVRHGATVIEAITLAKVLPLLIFVGVGLTAVRPAALAWPGWPEGTHLGPALLLVFWAISGSEIALQPGEEVKQPARTVPRAILLAVPAIAVFYLAIQTVAQGVLGADLAQLKDQNALAPAARVFLGSPGALLLTFGAAISMLGLLSGDLFATPRTWLAFARDGFVPRALARVHPRHRTPHLAIVTHAALVFLAGATGTFGKLVELSGTMILTMYLLCCAAAWQLHRRGTQLPTGLPFAPRGAVLIPWLAMAFLAWILSQQPRADLLTAGMAVLGAVSLHAGRAVWRTAR